MIKLLLIAVISIITDGATFHISVTPPPEILPPLIIIPSAEIIPFTCQTRVGSASSNPSVPSTASCEIGETLVSCGVTGSAELQGTTISPMDSNTCIAGTSNAAWAVAAVANCCQFPSGSIDSVISMVGAGQIDNQVVTQCPLGSTLTGCQVNYVSGTTSNIRGSYPGPQQATNTPPAQVGTEGISTQNQCIAEARTSDTIVEGGAQCLETAANYELDCVTTGKFTNRYGFTGDCPDDYQLIACNTYTPTHTLDAWYIVSGGTGCYIQQDSHYNQYANGICCQLRKYPDPTPEPTAQPTDYSPCLSGDIMYLHGQTGGYIGETCTGDNTFDGTQSICNDGTMERIPYSGECYEGASCCQSGEPGTWGGATCLSSATCEEWVDPRTEIVPFECSTRTGPKLNDPLVPSTVSCETGETLVSCGVIGSHELQGTYIDPDDSNTCIAGTSSIAWGVTAVANCCIFPTDAIDAVSTITNEDQSGTQVVTECPSGSALTGCQVSYVSGTTNNIRGSYPGPQQDENTPPAQVGTEGIDTENQCIAEARSSDTNIRGGAQCIDTASNYILDCVTTGAFTNMYGFTGDCPADYQLIACNTYTPTHTLDSWYIVSGGTGCYIQQDSHFNQYANGICCQLRKVPDPTPEPTAQPTESVVVPFECQARRGTASNNPSSPSTVTCEAGETLVSCGIAGSQDLYGTYIDPENPNTCVAGTSSVAWAVSAIANCCIFPTNAITSINTQTNEDQSGTQVLTQCPSGSTLTGCQVNYQSGSINGIRGSYPGPQQGENTPPAQIGTDGIDTENQCIAEARTDDTNLRGGAQCLETASNYELDCVTTGAYTNKFGFTGDCPEDYQLIACNTYTPDYTLDAWYITEDQGCYIQQDSHINQYANGICCQLRRTGESEPEPTREPTTSECRHLKLGVCNISPSGYASMAYCSEEVISRTGKVIPVYLYTTWNSTECNPCYPNCEPGGPEVVASYIESRNECCGWETTENPTFVLPTLEPSGDPTAEKTVFPSVIPTEDPISAVDEECRYIGKCWTDSLGYSNMEYCAVTGEYLVQTWDDTECNPCYPYCEPGDEDKLIASTLSSSHKCCGSVAEDPTAEKTVFPSIIPTEDPTVAVPEKCRDLGKCLTNAFGNRYMEYCVDEYYLYQEWDSTECEVCEPNCGPGDDANLVVSALEAHHICCGPGTVLPSIIPSSDPTAEATVIPSIIPTEDPTVELPEKCRDIGKCIVEDDGTSHMEYCSDDDEGYYLWTHWNSTECNPCYPNCESGAWENVVTSYIESHNTCCGPGTVIPSIIPSSDPTAEDTVIPSIIPTADPTVEVKEEDFYIYLEIDAGVTFEEAKNLCLDRGTNLASIANREELDVAYEIVDQNVGSQQAWIGLYSSTLLRDGDGFAWLDGSECVLAIPKCIPWWVQDKPINLAPRGGGSRCANLSPRLINNEIQCEDKLKGVLCNGMSNL